MSKKSTGKRYKAINPALSSEQQHALAQFQRDYQKAHPVMMQARAVAERLWKELLDADEWRIATSQVPEHFQKQVEQPEMWSVGHAKVNYVDKIDIKGDSE